MDGRGGEGHGSASSTVQRGCCYRQGEEESDATRQTRARQATGSSVILWARRGAAGRRHGSWRNPDTTATATATAKDQSAVGRGTPATSRMVDGCGARGRARGDRKKERQRQSYEGSLSRRKGRARVNGRISFFAHMSKVWIVQSAPPCCSLATAMCSRLPEITRREGAPGGGDASLALLSDTISRRSPVDETSNQTPPLSPQSHIATTALRPGGSANNCEPLKTVLTLRKCRGFVQSTESLC